MGNQLFGSSAPSHTPTRPSTQNTGRVFAHEVRIRGWSEVGGRVGGFVVYNIVIKLKTGSQIELFRRYSSFVRLRQALATERPDEAAQGQSKFGSSKNVRLPPLPPKHPLHKYAATYLESRRRTLLFLFPVLCIRSVVQAGAETD